MVFVQENRYTKFTKTKYLAYENNTFEKKYNYLYKKFFYIKIKIYFCKSLKGLIIK